MMLFKWKFPIDSNKYGYIYLSLYITIWTLKRMSTKAHCVLSPLIMLKIIHLCLIVVVVCVTPDRKEERLFDLTIKKDFHLLFWFAHALKVTQCPICIYSLQGKQCVGVDFLTEAVSELYVFAMSFSFVSFVVWHCFLKRVAVNTQ